MSPSGAAPAQPSLRRLQRFGVRPDRELGQNFLIDSNILGVIGREAAPAPPDVVLEVGGGLGVLSEYLAERVAHLHVVEIDERLREALEDALAGYGNVSLWWADAMRLDLGALQPPPVKVVANLPYGIAAGFAPALGGGAPDGGAVGGDGPARGGRAAGRRSGQWRLRAALRARPARLRGARRAGDSPQRLLPGAERRLGAVAADPSRRAGRPGRPLAPSRGRCARWWRRASPTGARRWWARCAWRAAPRTRSGGSASACGRRWPRSGWQPTSAPSASRRSSSWRWHGSSSGEPRRRRGLGSRTVSRPAPSAHAGAGEGEPRAVRGARSQQRRPARAGQRDAVAVARRRAQPRGGATPGRGRRGHLPGRAGARGGEPRRPGARRLPRASGWQGPRAPPAGGQADPAGRAGWQGARPTRRRR